MDVDNETDGHGTSDACVYINAFFFLHSLASNVFVMLVRVRHD